MKILIATGIFPPDIGGPATYSKILADELPKRGVGVDVLSFGSVRALPKVARHFIYFFKVFWRGIKADIIFAQDPVSVGFPAVIAATILRKPLVLKIVGDYAWEQGVGRFGVKELLDEFLTKKYGWRVEFLRKIQKFVANRANKIIVPSNYLKRVVVTWGIDQMKIEMVYNAFYFSKAIDYYYERTGDVERNQLGLSGKRVVVSAGRLVPWKGFTGLVEVIADLTKNFPNLELIVIGEGPERPKIEKKIKELELKNHVRLIGSVSHPELLKYLKAANVFVLNTAYEGLSHQILEAMAMGVPVVTTDAGGNTELVDKESGFLFKHNDKDAIKRIITLIFNDETKIVVDNVPVYLHGSNVKNIIESARKKVMENAKEFSLNTMIKETLKVFGEAT